MSETSHGQSIYTVMTSVKPLQLTLAIMKPHVVSSPFSLLVSFHLFFLFFSHLKYIDYQGWELKEFKL